MFPKVNQPSNPSVCCQETNSTNPSFVVAFLNLCFSPLYLQVYTDSMSIFIAKVTLIKLEQIWPKNMLQKYFMFRQFGPRISPFGRRIFTRARLKNQCQFGPQTTPFGPWIDSFQKPQFLQFCVTFTTDSSNKAKHENKISCSTSS